MFLLNYMYNYIVFPTLLSSVIYFLAAKVTISLLVLLDDRRLFCSFLR